jgi:hypothetical protein
MVVVVVVAQSSLLETWGTSGNFRRFKASPTLHECMINGTQMKE